jgi:ABC-type glycerol-3-phosphate transport system permease component
VLGELRPGWLVAGVALECLSPVGYSQLARSVLPDRRPSGSATLPLVQYVSQSQFQANYPAAFASYLMAMAPMLYVHVFAQRRVISGVTQGAVK